MQYSHCPQVVLVEKQAILYDASGLAAKKRYCTQVVLVVQTKTMVYESVNASGFGPQKSNTVRVWCNKTILYAGRFDSQKSNVERRWFGEKTVLDTNGFGKRAHAAI